MRRGIQCLGAFLLICSSTAMECDWGNSTNGLQIINSQEELDSLSRGCTTIINAAVIVASNYTGSFVLSGVTEIAGYFGFGNSDQDSQLTSIGMQDLVSFNALKSLEVRRASELTYVSFPKLRIFHGSGLDIDDAPNVQLSFPSLLNPTSISIYGGLSSMAFPLLTQIDDNLMLYSVRGCGSEGIPTADAAKFAINFPFLVRVSLLRVDGNILSLSLPELSKVGRDRTHNNTNLDGSGLDISPWGYPLRVDFPKLSVVTNQLDIKMNFGSISLPSLTMVPNIVNIHSHVKEDIVLPALAVVGELYATGSMTAISLPVLQAISRMILWNGLEFSSCTKEIAAFNRYLATHQTDTHPFKCKWKKDKEPLGSGAIIGICAGTAFIVGMLTIYFILWRRSQRKKAAKKKQEQEEYEMQQRYVAADCDSVAGTEVGSVHSDVTVVQQGGRGYIHRGAGDVSIVR